MYPPVQRCSGRERKNPDDPQAERRAITPLTPASYAYT